SACSGACASLWPPVTTGGSPTASGSAKASDLGTITRSDGAKQVTYDGHPLYYYAGDSSSGQTNGQGTDSFGAKWWLVAPGGTSRTRSGAGTAPSAPASSAGGGWSYLTSDRIPDPHHGHQGRPAARHGGSAAGRPVGVYRRRRHVLRRPAGARRAVRAD